MGRPLAGTCLWLSRRGSSSKLVADAPTRRLRGTAFAIFHLTTGGAVLPASVVAGALWSRFGPPATFIAGAALAVVAFVGVLTYDGGKRG